MIGKLKAIMITMDLDGNIVQYDVLSIKISLTMTRKKAMQSILKNPSRIKTYLNLNALKENILLGDFKTLYNKDNTMAISYKIHDLNTFCVSRGILILG